MRPEPVRAGEHAVRCPVFQWRLLLSSRELKRF
jgi:hypothetical protein